VFSARPMPTSRMVIYDLLQRTRRYHCPIGAVYEWDFTDTLARLDALKEKGSRVGLAAMVTKATATVIAEHPRLNQRLFYGLTGPRLVAFDEISCNLVILRKGRDDRDIIFPLVLRHVDRCSVEEIAEEIHRHKTMPLGDVPQLRQMSALKRVPRPLLKAHDFKVRTDPGYFIKRFGTYGLSAMTHRDSGLIGGQAIAPSTTFYPTNIQDRPMVKDGEIVIRTTLLFGVMVDHYVADGMETIRACQRLKQLIEEPEHILGGL
jgi:pyruvate/2-oxoglutarate dehydrogenase complex dihydrolipoamide acyltransferase (E2) component